MYVMCDLELGVCFPFDILYTYTAVNEFTINCCIMLGWCKQWTKDYCQLVYSGGAIIIIVK